jgi:hypothetical protein
MTDTASTCHLEDKPKQAAALTPCSECPWRQSNTGRKHVYNIYSDDQFTRNWRGIAVDGKFFGCHLFDGDAHRVPPESQAMGYKKAVDIGGRKECAGAVAMIRRELQILASYDSHEEYIKARPVGLTQRALVTIKERMAGNLAPELRFPIHGNDDLVDPMGRVDTDSPNWKYSREALAELSIVLHANLALQCECPVCTEHTTVHRPKELTTVTGDTVEVDEELHELLDAMNSAGIRTVSSCVNLADALEQLWPEQKLALLQKTFEGGLHYRDTIARRAAYIRFNNSTVPAKAFVMFAAKIPGVEVNSLVAMTQMEFPPAAIPHLTTLAKKLKTAAEHAVRKRR